MCIRDRSSATQSSGATRLGSNATRGSDAVRSGNPSQAAQLGARKQCNSELGSSPTRASELGSTNHP
eukprot:6392751-Alexandrium_andersonii.AAC.1